MKEVARPHERGVKKFLVMKLFISPLKAGKVLAPLFLAATVLTSSAAPVDPTIVERGAHHRVWQRTTERLRHDGKVIKQFSSYVEVGMGLHYQADPSDPNSPWLDSREVIELFQDGAIARQGQHRVIFSPQINSAGAIDLMTVDGKRFRSHVLGLAYTDAATGNAAMIAEIKDSTGVLVAPNQIIYPDAFTDVKADVRFTYTTAGFEQDIILQEEPPSPAAYGLNPATTRLEVYTEFIEPPVPSKELIVLKEESNPVTRAAMFEPDLVDERLNFGAMLIGSGHAFPVADGAQPLPDDAVPTAKSWEQREGRNLLIEKVEYSSIQPHLLQLPKAAALNRPGQAVAKARAGNGGAKTLLAQFRAPPVRAKGSSPPIRMASVPRREKGLVLDYLFLNTSSNFTFKSDTTYLVYQATLTGTTVIEGGTVVKYTNGTINIISLAGPLDCRTGPYHPAIFTSKDDDTVGETISGSTGIPTNSFNGGRVLSFGSSTNYDLHDIRIRYSDRAITLVSGNLDVSHAQIGFGNWGIYNNGNKPLAFRNVLFHDLNAAIQASATSNTNNRGEHLTAHKIVYLIGGSSGFTGKVFLTNCLLISVTNALNYFGSNIVTNQNDAGIFQTVGAGAHYLANNSAYRNAGTTNINATLLANLKRRTTYPPLVLTNNITVNTTLVPQARRDTDIPDLGYLYDPLDYVFYKVALTNATLTITPGTAVGIYGADHGLWLHDGGNLVCEGTADNLCRIVRCNLVQEQANTNWSSLGVGFSITALGDNWEASPQPSARFRFTDFAMPAYGGYHFYVPWANMPTVVFRDCQILGGNFYSDLPAFAFTNCLFERVSLYLVGASGEYHNNLFYGGSFTFDGWSQPHIFTDNLFDQTTLSQNNSVTHSHNGYSTTNRLTPTNITDVLWTSLAYQTGLSGRYYLPTNAPLINVGSVTNAGLVGLYHFTTATNQVAETNSVLDISVHFAAATGSLQVLDTDGDGLLNVAEDSNGNGAFESGLGETDWQNYNSIYGIGPGPGLVVFTPLK